MIGLRVSKGEPTDPRYFLGPLRLGELNLSEKKSRE